MKSSTFSEGCYIPQALPSSLCLSYIHLQWMSVTFHSVAHRSLHLNSIWDFLSSYKNMRNALVGHNSGPSGLGKCSLTMLRWCYLGRTCLPSFEIRCRLEAKQGVAEWTHLKTKCNIYSVFCIWAHITYINVDALGKFVHHLEPVLLSWWNSDKILVDVTLEESLLLLQVLINLFIMHDMNLYRIFT